MKKKKTLQRHLGILIKFNLLVGLIAAFLEGYDPDKGWVWVWTGCAWFFLLGYYFYMKLERSIHGDQRFELMNRVRQLGIENQQLLTLLHEKEEIIGKLVREKDPLFFKYADWMIEFARYHPIHQINSDSERELSRLYTSGASPQQAAEILKNNYHATPDH